MATARTFMSGPRVWPQRTVGLMPSPIGSQFFKTTPVLTYPQASELEGHQNRAWLTFGSIAANTAWGIAAGCLMGDMAGANMTITVTVTGALTIIQSGLNITIQVAAGGSTPNAIVAAILAAFPAITGLPCNSFAQGFIPGGTGAGTYNTAVAIQKMKQDQRFRAGLT